ncbi:MAG: SIMPL domain-containing protein, partial [Hyphomicrobiales bacterium]|nr:SIMPL domain-containing protein [Hyphomicrobiales bacterium]
RFAVDDTTALYDDARRAAVADAVRKAKILTEAAGATLGRITNISENRSTPIAPLGGALAMTREMAAPVPVEAGELNFRVDVQITWEIAP